LGVTAQIEHDLKAASAIDPDLRAELAPEEIASFETAVFNAVANIWRKVHGAGHEDDLRV